MSVDLSSGFCGIVAFANGTRFYSPMVYFDQSEYLIRWESGWYKSYTRTGEAIASGLVINPDGTKRVVQGSDCVEFIPCNYTDPRAKGLPTEHTP